MRFAPLWWVLGGIARAGAALFSVLLGADTLRIRVQAPRHTALNTAQGLYGLNGRVALM